MKAQRWSVSNTVNGGFEGAEGLSPLAAAVISARGYTTHAAKTLLFNNQLCDPLLMADMPKAVEALGEAVDSGALICVYGDYDCDGVCATAMVSSYLESIGARSCYYIPNREKEGYGLNIPAIDELCRLGVTLILTVDNGISAIEEVAYANSVGISVIITDHHTPRDVLPNAAAVINPHRSDCPYPFKDLCGAGVAFKLLCAMEGESGESLLEQFSDLLALATVADIVSLTGENRVFVAHGLKNLEDSLRPGIRALLSLAALEGKILSSEDVAFGLAPRINAAGRLDSADLATMLLLSEDNGESTDLAQQLEALNLSRREQEKKIIDDIAIMLKNNPFLADLQIPVFVGENWNAGVVGIVCSRLVERFERPVLLIVLDKADAKGSGRSVEGFSLIGAIAACGDCLTRFGGHPMAAGFSLKRDEVASFIARLQDYAASLDAPIPLPYLKVDLSIGVKLLTLENAKSLDVLAPFGNGNEPPVFSLSGTLIQITPLSQGKHVKLLLDCSGIKTTALCFSTTPTQLGLNEGDSIDIAFTISVNEYQGKESVSLKCLSARLSGVDYDAMGKGKRRYEAHRRKELFQEPQLTREEMGIVYRGIKSEATLYDDQDALYCHLYIKSPLDYCRFCITLDVLDELKLLVKDSRERLVLNLSSPKVDLQSSAIVRSMTKTK